MHKQTTCCLSRSRSPSLCLSFSAAALSVYICGVSFTLRRAHKFVLVACATFLLRIFIMCLSPTLSLSLSLPLLISRAGTKSTLCCMPHGAYHLPRPVRITAAAAPRCKLHYLQSDASRRQRGLCATWRAAQIVRRGRVWAWQETF